MFWWILSLCSLVLGVSGILSVRCGVGICQGKCGVNACIKYFVPVVNFGFEKCMTTTECTGIHPGDYDLFNCSDISDPTGQMNCSNQYCYFHSEQRRNVCLAPPAIGLVDSEYDKACAAATRDLFQEIADLKRAIASLQVKFEIERQNDKI